MDNEIKLSPIALGLHALGLVAFFVFTFIGTMFIAGSGWPIWGFVCVILIVVIFGIVRALYKTKSDFKSQRFGSIEIILLAIYLLVFASSTPLLFHSFALQVFRKESIKESALEKVNKITALQTEYQEAIQENKVSFKNKADRLWREYNIDKRNNFAALRSLGLMLNVSEVALATNSSLDQTLVENAWNKIFNDNLNVAKLNTKTNLFVAEAKKVFQNWEHIRIAEEYAQTDTVFNEYLAEIKKKMPEHQFNAALDKSYDLQNVFFSIKTSSLIQNILFISLLLVIHLLILSPYFMAARPALRPPHSRI